MLKVVQCWDDGVHDDIRLIEILRKYEARASFNLNSALHKQERCGWYDQKRNKDVFRLALSELRCVYAGFTIANHTMTHPRPLEISLSQWRGEVVDSRKWLQDFFQQPVLGFAYPFGDCSEQTAAVVREAGHVYARTTLNRAPGERIEDPMMLPSDCHFLSENFWQRYEAAKESGDGFFYFWGHSYEMNTEQLWDRFEACIRRISSDPQAQWAEMPDLFVR